MGGSKCNQSESTPACRTEQAEIWQGLGGRVHFRKPSSKCSAHYYETGSVALARGTDTMGTASHPRAHTCCTYTLSSFKFEVAWQRTKGTSARRSPACCWRRCFGWINAMGRIITVCREHFPFHPARLSFHSFHWGNNCLLWEAVCFKSLYLHLDITQAAHLQSSLIFIYIFFKVILRWLVLWLFAVVLVSKLKGSRTTWCDRNGCFLLHGGVLIFNNINVRSICCLL